MQRNVPQFIEIEDKIFGPFTLKQFGFLLGGFGISIIAWRSLPFSVAVFVMGPAIGVSCALAFAKYNTKPFIDIIRAGIYYMFSSKRFIWQSPSQKILRQREFDYKKEMLNDQRSAPAENKTISKDDIRDLAKRLNTK
jgi:PrgI family protein